MINVNTLKELNRFGIGANINKLESYVIDYKQASSVANLYEYEHDYLRMNRILKEIKPDSLAFTDKTSLETVETDKHDKILLKYPSSNINEIYGTKDKNIGKIRHYIESSSTDTVDIIAIPIIRGLNIRCLYSNGYLCRINLIGDGYKYTDLTDRFKNQLPLHIEEFSEYSTVELRGKITIFNNHPDLQNISLNIECSVMHLLRLHDDNCSMSIVFDDLIIDSNDKPFETQWDKIQFMRELGFSVPHHALIRNVEVATLSDAFYGFRDFFKNIENTTGITYSYSGYKIADNSELGYGHEYSKFNYIFDRCDYRQMYESKMKSLLTINKGEINLVMKIVSTECNDDVIISEVKIEDIAILDTYDIKPGCKVYFYVNNREAMLVKNRHCAGI